jgi:hypothetical protein
MIYVKVQYDAFNRMFKLVDQEFKTLLEGDALYDLAIPLMFEVTETEAPFFSGTSIAHA